MKMLACRRDTKDKLSQIVPVRTLPLQTGLDLEAGISRGAVLAPGRFSELRTLLSGTVFYLFDLIFIIIILSYFKSKL